MSLKIVRLLNHIFSQVALIDNEGHDDAIVIGKSMALYISLWKVNKPVIYQTNVFFGQAYREVNKGKVTERNLAQVVDLMSHGPTES